MVYHYRDGNLEYEEHFNAANILQEIENDVDLIIGVFMNKFLPVLLLGGVLLMHALILGYKLDQSKYPHDNKHSITVPNKLKKFVFLNRIECMKAAFILEMAGYTEFFLMLIVAIIFAISDYPGSKNNVTLLFTLLLSINTLWFFFTGIFYALWSRFQKKR